MKKSGDAHVSATGVPQYPIESVDNALKVLLLLGERNELRLTDVAEYLHVATSTAHRLLAMLATLSGQGTVSIVGFGDSGPGASPGVPLRTAELASPPGAKARYLPSVPALRSLMAQMAPPG